MKNLKLRKILLTICSAMLLVTLSVGATFAYLTSQATVTNTFTVGNVKITLDEQDVDKDSNTADNVTINEVVRDTANAYHLLPGQKYTKDPIVHVDAASETCWVFIKVTNDLAAIEADKKIADQISGNKWIALAGVDGVYYQTYTKGQDDKELEVFETVTIASTVDNTTLAAYSNKTVSVVAYAIQMAGFEDKPGDAWTAVSAASSDNN